MKKYITVATSNLFSHMCATQAVTGVSTKMFDAAVAIVENRKSTNKLTAKFDSPPSQPRASQKTADEARVIGFLDAYFKGI